MAIPILDIGCGASINLNSALSTLDNMINDILNGIEDITGAIADAVSSAISALGTALGGMLPDLSSLIPDISFSAGIDALLGFAEGSLGYLAKLAELTLQFGKAILNAGLNIFDMIADAALAFLKGLDPCSALSDDFSIGADGVAKASAAAVKLAEEPAEKEEDAPKVTLVAIPTLGTLAPKVVGGGGLQSNVTAAGNLGTGAPTTFGGGGLQSNVTSAIGTASTPSKSNLYGGTFGTATPTTTGGGGLQSNVTAARNLGTVAPTTTGGGGLQSNVTSTVNQIASSSASDVGNLRAKPQNIYGGGGLESTPTQILSTEPTLNELVAEVLGTNTQPIKVNNFDHIRPLSSFDRSNRDGEQELLDYADTLTEEEKIYLLGAF